MRHWILGCAMASLLACGGGEEQVESTTAGPLEADTAGDEALMEEPEPEPEPEGPTYGEAVPVTVALQVGTDEGRGTYTIEDVDGNQVADGASGDAESLRTGPYRVIATITDPRLLVDTPTREETVEVTEMTPMVVVKFPRAQVKLKVLQNGRPVRRATVTLTPQGGDEPVATVRDFRSFFPITPGRYQALIDLGNLQVPVNDLIFQEGARQEVPVNIN